MKIKDLWRRWLARGFTISYSDGPAYDPTDQERTDPLADIAKHKEVNIGRDKK